MRTRIFYPLFLAVVFFFGIFISSHSAQAQSCIAGATLYKGECFSCPEGSQFSEGSCKYRSGGCPAGATFHEGQCVRCPAGFEFSGGGCQKSSASISPSKPEIPSSKEVQRHQGSAVESELDTARSQSLQPLGQAPSSALSNNRTHSVFFRGVFDAPGDGNQALTREVTRLLSQSSVRLADTEEPDSITLSAYVSSETVGASDRIEIQWIAKHVSTAVPLGAKTRPREVPTGKLEKGWGEDAALAAKNSIPRISWLLKTMTGAVSRSRQRAKTSTDAQASKRENSVSSKDDAGIKHGQKSNGQVVGLGIRPKGGEAAKLYDSCLAGDPKDCTDLGVALKAGTKGAFRSQFSALVAFKMGCDGESAHGCNMVGVMHNSGLGAIADKVQAEKSYEKACRMGSRSGCGNLGNYLVAGSGGTKDVARGAELLNAACGNGSGWSCDRLKEHQESGVISSNFSPKVNADKKQSNRAQSAPRNTNNTTVATRNSSNAGGGKNRSTEVTRNNTKTGGKKNRSTEYPRVKQLDVKLLADLTSKNEHNFFVYYCYWLEGNVKKRQLISNLYIAKYETERYKFKYDDFDREAAETMFLPSDNGNTGFRLRSENSKNRIVCGASHSAERFLASNTTGGYTRSFMNLSDFSTLFDDNQQIVENTDQVGNFRLKYSDQVGKRIGDLLGYMRLEDVISTYYDADFKPTVQRLK